MYLPGSNDIISSASQSEWEIHSTPLAASGHFLQSAVPGQTGLGEEVVRKLYTGEITPRNRSIFSIWRGRIFGQQRTLTILVSVWRGVVVWPRCLGPCLRDRILASVSQRHARFSGTKVASRSPGPSRCHRQQQRVDFDAGGCWGFGDNVLKLLCVVWFSCVRDWSLSVGLFLIVCSLRNKGLQYFSFPACLEQADE